MRKILSMMAVATLLVFTACEKNEPEAIEEPANIPGMGNAEGDLQVDAYEMPDDIEIIGSIQGVLPDDLGSVNALDGLKATTGYACYGSGRDVKVQITMKNTSQTKNRTVFLPRGLVFKVNKTGYQHAMLMQWTWVCIKANSSRTFVLNLYCINSGLKGSDSSAEFSILGITNSEVMWKLLRMIGWRKINLEHYQQVNAAALLKSDDEISYDNIVTNVQEAVWELTNGSGLSEESIDYIEGIPFLEEGTYPADLDDKTVEPPYYFDEYTPVD